MYVANILYPVEVLGPGKRVGIWVSGCERRCIGCMSPELLVRDEKQQISIDTLFMLINEIKSGKAEGDVPQIDGFTISGGEPFLQSEQLCRLLKRLRTLSDDILVYTGYTLEELVEFPDESVRECLSHIGVLIDGPFMHERAGGALRGSDNQRIHILNSTLEKMYNEYCNIYENELQTFVSGESVMVVGIQRRAE